MEDVHVGVESVYYEQKKRDAADHNCRGNRSQQAQCRRLISFR